MSRRKVIPKVQTSSGLGHRWVLTSFGPHGDPTGNQTEWHCHRCESSINFWKEPDQHLIVWSEDGWKTCDEIMIEKVINE